MKRTVPLVAFQPTKENHLRLKPVRRRLPRGRITQIINAALELYFNQSAGAVVTGPHKGAA